MNNKFYDSLLGRNFLRKLSLNMSQWMQPLSTFGDFCFHFIETKTNRVDGWLTDCFPNYTFSWVTSKTGEGGAALQWNECIFAFRFFELQQSPQLRGLVGVWASDRRFEFGVRTFASFVFAVFLSFLSFSGKRKEGRPAAFAYAE